MELKNLKKHVRTLATLEKSVSPVISCYLNLGKGGSEARNYAEERMETIRKTVSKEWHVPLEDAYAQMDKFLEHNLYPDAKGIALFVRAGLKPFFLPLQFRVPIPNEIIVDSLPNIYHLIELKDTYHRYLVMICSQSSVRILEVNLGAVTGDIMKEKPTLRKRVGRGWTKAHYQTHQREISRRFIKEAIGVLQKRTAEGGYKHLVLAGNESILHLVRDDLPKSLSSILIDTVSFSENTSTEKVIRDSLSLFIQEEERESLNMVNRLQSEIQRGGLAVIGVKETQNALQRGQGDMIVLAQELDPNEREKIVRSAEQTSCHIETVRNNDALLSLGGVGCLLRYFMPNLKVLA